jgi:vacuolar-type H+-ATPase subunit E/Vma4
MEVPVKALGSPAAVVAALRDDADAEVELIERETQASLARLAAEEAAEPPVLPERELRLAAAHRRAREQLAQEDVLDAREALEGREAWLARAVAAGQRAIEEPAPAPQRRAELGRLAREGLDRLAGEAIDVLVAPADAALLDDAWARDLAPGRAVRVVASTELAHGGCLVRSADGKVTFDNTLPARARRFEAAWRSALGALYQGAGRTA